MRRAVNSSLAVAYLRVSTDEQHLGPEAQRAAIESWARARGVHVVAWHEDRNVGGAQALEQRPGLVAALASLRASRAATLVAAKRDRLARDVELAGALEVRVRRLGARVATADGTSDKQTTDGRLLMRMVDVFAEHERAVIRDRTRAALAAKRARGERVSGQPPYGFRHEAGRLVADEREQLVLQQLEQLLERGLSLRQIAVALTARGCRSRAPDGRWHKTTLARLARRGPTGHRPDGPCPESEG
nr:recombinase family protein [Nannocystis sp. ILAH1]